MRPRSARHYFWSSARLQSMLSESQTRPSSSRSVWIGVSPGTIARSIGEHAGAPVTGAASSRAVSMLSMFTLGGCEARLRPGAPTRPGRAPDHAEPVGEPRALAGTDPHGRCQLSMDSGSGAEHIEVGRDPFDGLRRALPAIDIAIANCPCVFAIRLASMLPPRAKTRLRRPPRRSPDGRGRSRSAPRARSSARALRSRDFGIRPAAASPAGRG